MSNRFVLRTTLLGIAVQCISGWCVAQSYPVRPIRWVLGFPAGGTSDIIARAVAAQLTEALAQQVIIDNRPGASGIIANDLVAKSPPDGYTLLLMSATYANLISAAKKLPYDAVNDLTPVILMTSVQNILAVPPRVQAHSVKDLISIAKSEPGKLNYASGGAGTAAHLAGELFRVMTGTDIVHVAYKGSPPAMNDLLAGRVDMMFALSPLALPHVKTGKLQALAVSGKRRMTDLPEVPTVAETVPGFEALGWQGVMVPSKTPHRIVDLLNRQIAQALKTPAVADRLPSFGFDAEGGSPQDFKAYLDTEVSRWRDLIRRAKIEVF